MLCLPHRLGARLQVTKTLTPLTIKSIFAFAGSKLVLHPEKQVSQLGRFLPVRQSFFLSVAVVALREIQSTGVINPQPLGDLLHVPQLTLLLHHDQGPSTVLPDPFLKSSPLVTMIAVHRLMTLERMVHDLLGQRLATRIQVGNNVAAERAVVARSSEVEVHG